MSRKFFLLVVVLAVVAVLAAPQAFAADQPKAEKVQSLANFPVIGIVFAMVEFSFSAVKNIIECKGFDCVNIPKSLGKAALNSAERVIGTSTLGFAGLVDQDLGYNRPMMVNGPLAQNKILSNLVGWGGLGWIVGGGATGLHMFGIDHQPTSWMVLGGVVGTATAGADIGIDGGRITEPGP